MTLEHVAMLAAMFAVMIARPDEYSHARPEHHDANATAHV